ncbi:hypothetical protein GLOIN_2v1789000 [Rhizophagus irregularis DAOM 181602=DAOM 197198]|uniref:Uncharacterized protein n=1 Tax=Rhizophagus irregularis (strain DAOM 181602 / DAOM 197198 / MUCL 43194) TaxID=747089 RepID=A0A2P4P2C8_RHIID|nr:hypothetical protein GLOIN_2v1789000 [Rhizophagus irregularis DAOM 181602=DAOM 197198]POG59537.1 hypothetical protein GLOIN_2v1789000 [Rhizophagus irregularis DAOM 181602=DAOM 197198]|eukprot:XP_025166403.1 hypothetical protein GLOIN_2v1789000 [Rhizophagus irregularis DAOM 181602=DAOM 197198]
MEPIDDFGGSGWNLSIILEFRVPDRTIKDFGIQRFVMEPIKDIGIQRFWIEPIKDFGIQSAALDFIFEGSDSRSSSIHIYGPSVPDFGDNWFFCFGLWRRKFLQFLDFGDNGFFGSWTLKTTGISALYFGLVLVKPFHIGETLHFGSVSVRSFTLDPVSIGIGWDLWIGIGCDLWKPVHRLETLDRYRLRPLETCGID